MAAKTAAQLAAEVGIMLPLKPIPTEYKGITFRSRLEASWASYFDELGLTWSYEPEGYQLLSGEKYLPDFHLTQWHASWSPKELFVECKPPHKGNLRKAGYFVRQSKKPLLLAFPEGRFFICMPRHARYLIENDWESIEFFTKLLPSLAMVGDDAVGGPYNYFWNGGEESDCYVGCAPDWFDTIKDRSRPDGGDARTFYFGGFSTWGQRGFEPPRWSAK